MPLVPVPARKFTKDAPCNKGDLYACFWSPTEKRYVRRAVVEARGVIGLLAIKHMMNKGYAIATMVAGVDYWQLTSAGQIWLTQGYRRFKELEALKAGASQTNAPAVDPDPAPAIPAKAPASPMRRIIRKIQ